MPEPREFAGPVPRSSPALAVGFSVERNLAEDPRDVTPVGLVWKNRVLPAESSASDPCHLPVLHGGIPLASLDAGRRVTNPRRRQSLVSTHRGITGTVSIKFENMLPSSLTDGRPRWGRPGRHPHRFP